MSNVIDHTCVCPRNYRGRNCTIEILPCDTNPCARGKCIPNGKSYKCVCNPGFYGELCNSHVDPALLTTTPQPVVSVSSSPTSPAVSTPATSVSATTTTKTTLPPSSSMVTATKPMTNSSLSTQTGIANTTTQVTSPMTSPGKTSSVSNGSTSTSGPDPCADPSVCNAPSTCVPKGSTYVCECPETKATMADPCISPYYFEMFAICCTVDTCQPGGQPNCS